ncbi:putative transposase, Ptta/En/Spm, plant, transposase, Tnp1/En/Spm [Rosa chinensis]|uniref:Putative transposase, Ptta/En/Spm, plant, transposase, Tnp1/En/Spm n=1 Tax=Rosa chinensis TaxID=74649 RepID=A0A2P6P7X2_ROSCH|nr:putative transposase, Ptta/En/Spm, plant, transposase, Tnp1/En/Spm [Rosa chinensis]
MRKKKEKRALNKYPHRMSRKGYAGLEEELSATMEESSLDRATMWIKARQDKNGSFKYPSIEEKAQKIADLKKKEAKGELSTCGVVDVLTLALGNPEHVGKIRGVGANVKQDTYFHLPKRRKESVEATMRLSVQKIMEQEREKILAEEQTIWEERLRKIEAKLNGKVVENDSPKVSTVDKQVGSEQGSCSNLLEKSVKCNENLINSNVKKSLNLEHVEHVQHVEGYEKDVNTVDEVNLKAEEKNEQNVEVPVVEDLEIQKGECQAQPIGKQCKLALGSIDNVVAVATIVEVNKECKSQLIHGVPLGEGNMRVSILLSVVDSALLPFPIKDEILTVRDAIGTYVAWPKDLIIFPTDKMAAKSTTMKKRKMAEENDDDDEEDLDIDSLPPNIPASFKMVCMWVK